MAWLALMLCLTIQATFTPTAHIVGDHFGKAVIAKGGRPRIVATGMWGSDETEVRARLKIIVAAG